MNPLPLEDLVISSDRITAIRAKYQASLEDKLHTLESLWSTSNENYAELLPFLHQLAGSSGMYGYDEISASSVELQRIIKNSSHVDEIALVYNQLIKLIRQNLDA